MLDFIKNLFKREQPKQVRVCNKCGFIWESKEDSTGKTCYSRGLCPECCGIDTQLATDWPKANRDKIQERREHYMESLGKKEKSRKIA